MKVKLYNYIALLTVITLLCVGVVIFSEVTGIRQKYEAEKLQAQALKIEAETEKMEALPLVVSALVDTGMAVIYAVSDRILLIAATIYIIIILSAKEEDHEKEEV